MDWKRRVQELTMKNSKSMTDAEFFSSKEYEAHTSAAAKNAISGVVGYLNRLGFKITAEEEKRRRDKVKIAISYDDSEGSMTAATNGGDVIINAGNELVRVHDDRMSRHMAVQGFRVHEMGHVLFTDFQAARRWFSAMENGHWWPEEPAEHPDAASAIQSKLADAEWRNIFMSVAHYLDNTVEDGYIENEIRAMFPGKATRQLATLNDSMWSKREPFVVKEGEEMFPLLLNQLLYYMRFGETDIAECEQEVTDAMDECYPLIEDGKTSRSPKARKKAVNEMLCILYPFLDEYIEHMKQEKQQQQQQQQGQQGQGQQGQGQGEGQEGSQSSNEVPSDVADSVMKRLASIANNNGQTQDPQGTSSLVGDAQENGMQSKVANSTPSQGTHGGTGAAEGADASDREAHVLEEKIASASAKAEAQEEYTDELRKDSPSVNITRAAFVSDESISEYERRYAKLSAVSKGLQHKLLQILKARREGGKIDGLPFGRRLEARSLVHKDGRYFSNKKGSSQEPSLAVGMLIDESGSTSGETIQAALNTAIVVEDFCRVLDIPCVISGYTAWGEVTIHSYVDPVDIDKNDKYRLVGMDSNGGTPTGEAMEYMRTRLKKIDADTKMMIVISDGGSCNHGRVTQELDFAKKEKVLVIGAGVGSARNEVKSEFPDNFLDVSDLNTMPQTLCNIIKKRGNLS